MPLDSGYGRRRRVNNSSGVYGKGSGVIAMGGYNLPRRASLIVPGNITFAVIMQVKMVSSAAFLFSINNPVMSNAIEIYRADVGFTSGIKLVLNISVTNL